MTTSPWLEKVKEIYLTSNSHAPASPDPDPPIEHRSPPHPWPSRQNSRPLHLSTRSALGIPPRRPPSHQSQATGDRTSFPRFPTPPSHQAPLHRHPRRPRDAAHTRAGPSARGAKAPMLSTLDRLACFQARHPRSRPPGLRKLQTGCCPACRRRASCGFMMRDGGEQTRV